MKSKAILISIIVVIMSLFVGIVGAQEDESSDTDRNGRGRGLLGDIVELVIEETGLTTEEVFEQLSDGATLTEVIENAGGDVAVVMTAVDALIDAQVEELFTTEFDFSGRNGNIRDRIQNGVIGEVATAVADATGLERSEILQQVRDGATLADLITDNGGDVDTVIATIVESVTTAVNERLDSGDIDQEQADTILENLEETVTDWVNGDTPLPNRPNRSGRGGGGNN